MKRGISILLFVLVAVPAAHAQPSELNETQLLGRQVFAQSCGICHLQPTIDSRPFGPKLHKSTSGGNEETLRTLIVNGTDRMPSFKYFLKPAEVDAIIAYLKTVPVPAAAPARTGAAPAAAPPD